MRARSPNYCEIHRDTAQFSSSRHLRQATRCELSTGSGSGRTAAHCGRASGQRVRFTPTQMDVDETSKLWGMFSQTPYVLSVVYQAALVLVEGRELPQPQTPVRERTVKAAPSG